MKCPDCKKTNKDTARYCQQCGSKMNKYSLQNGEGKNVVQYFMSNTPIWIFIVISLILILVIVISTDQKIQHYNLFTDIPSEDPLVEAKVFKISELYYCTCSKCNKEPLNICKCSFALESRQFIRKYLEDGKNDSSVIVAFDTKYGGRISN